MRFNFNLCEEEDKKQGNLRQEVKQEEEEQEDFDITDLLFQEVEEEEMPDGQAQPAAQVVPQVAPSS